MSPADMTPAEYAAHLAALRADLGFDDLEDPRPLVLELPERERIGWTS